MRLLHGGLCLIASIAAGFVFALAASITASTKSESSVEWTRSCQFSVEGSRFNVACDDYKDWFPASEQVAAALGKRSFVAECRGVRSRGVFARTILDCGQPQ